MMAQGMHGGVPFPRLWTNDRIHPTALIYRSQDRIDSLLTPSNVTTCSSASVSCSHVYTNSELVMLAALPERSHPDRLLSRYGIPQPSLVSLSLMGISDPVVLLYLPRMKSLICSSLACSTADSLSCLPWPMTFSWAQSTPVLDADQLPIHVRLESLTEISVIPLSSMSSFFSLSRPLPAAELSLSPRPPRKPPSFF